MFKWDGSEVTDFLKREDVYWEEAIYEKYVLWRIYHKKLEEICYVRSCSSTISCLIDELKPVFKIEKMGTHFTKFHGRMLILLKPNIVNNVVIEDISLSQVNVKEETFKDQIRNIFLFRELMGVSRSTEKSIIFRQYKDIIKPISFYEPNMNPNKDYKVISNTVLNKWFDGSIDTYMREFLNISKREEITETLFKLRSEMEKIVNRIDKRAIAYVDAILNRIRSRLQHILVA